MEFKVSLQEEQIQENKVPAQIPNQVALLVDTFKGTIVAGKM